MVSEFNHTSYVIDLLDKMLDTDRLSKSMKVYTDKLIEPIDVLHDWKLNFWATYGDKDQIAIYKRGAVEKAEKCKQIVIHIPIPTNKTIPWGVMPDKRVKVKLPPNWEKNFLFLEINPSLFDNMYDYVLDSLERSVKAILDLGFTIQGSQIKI